MGLADKFVMDLIGASRRASMTRVRQRAFVRSRPLKLLEGQRVLSPVVLRPVNFDREAIYARYVDSTLQAYQYDMLCEEVRRGRR